MEHAHYAEETVILVSATVWSCASFAAGIVARRVYVKGSVCEISKSRRGNKHAASKIRNTRMAASSVLHTISIPNLLLQSIATALVPVLSGDSARRCRELHGQQKPA